jgi:FAD/FMN-containing dehydrogenase
MKKSLLTKKRIFTFFFFALFLFLTLKIHEYAGTPVEAKNCDFSYPQTTNSNKPTTVMFDSPEELLEFQQKGGFINDASCLNKTAVYGIVKIDSEEDIKKAILFAQEHDLKITSAGQQHSMGGQTFTQNGLILNMKSLNQMKLNSDQKTLTVQSGALWSEVQKFLDKQGYSVKAMQSINIFTVGGTLSVNAHGIAHDPGQIAPTVKSLKIMLSNGEVQTASPTENAELFKSVLGGYGLFGVILEAELEVVDNEMYEWTRDFMDYKEFPEYYKKNIEDNKEIGLLYGRLSVSPSSYLTETVIHKYTKTNFEGERTELEFEDSDWINRLVINFSKTGSVGRWTRWALEKYVEPSIHLCSRNEAMSQKEVCIVSRNQEMYDSMGYLKNKLKDTDILQEYFIPHEKMPEFVDRLRETVIENKANLLNVTIRMVSKDTVTALPYAKEDMFAFVLYFNQKLNEEDSKVLQKTTTELIDVATDLGGAFYLPYQLYYSKEQLQKAYPTIDHFFETKKKYDPEGLFTNKFYEKYVNE